MKGECAMRHSRKNEKYFIDLQEYVGIQIRARRTVLKLSQEAFCEKAGLSSSKYFSKVERGENISLHTLATIAKALGVEPSELLPKNELNEDFPQDVDRIKALVDSINSNPQKTKSLSLILKVIEDIAEHY